MPRANAMVPTEAIRIEDEVWQEAFTRREPGRPSRERRLRPVDREDADWLLEATGEAAEEHLWADAVPAATPNPVSAAAGVASDAAAVASPAAGVASPGAPVASPAVAVPGRRTVKIQGRGAERNMPWPDTTRRRPPRRAYERTGFRPDRVAMWAVLLGFALVLVAIVSAH